MGLHTHLNIVHLYTPSHIACNPLIAALDMTDMTWYKIGWRDGELSLPCLGP